MKRNLKKIAFALVGLSFCVASCSNSSLTKIVEFQCDSFFEFYDYEGGNIANSLKEKVDELENIFDPYKEGTELYRLNKERTLTVSDDNKSGVSVAEIVDNNTITRLTANFIKP